MTQLMDQIQRMVPHDTTVLFTGETGTGKTRTARLIHDMSPQRDEPVYWLSIAIRCRRA